ncbi:hypothetical protein [Capnocytophaga sputigena]|nr:hypothetical protein [Capnocytophaga sputigena]VEI53175.1 Uncharacterised protein [Capnocytophaga sputigena]
MNRFSYFITFIVVLTLTSCDAWYCCGFRAMTTEGENDRDASVHFYYNK